MTLLTAVADARTTEQAERRFDQLEFRALTSVAFTDAAYIAALLLIYPIEFTEPSDFARDLHRVRNAKPLWSKYGTRAGIALGGVATNGLHDAAPDIRGRDDPNLPARRAAGAPTAPGQGERHSGKGGEHGHRAGGAVAVEADSHQMTPTSGASVYRKNALWTDNVVLERFHSRYGYPTPASLLRQA